VNQQLVEAKIESTELNRRTRLLNSLIWILMGALGLFLVYVLAAGLQSLMSGLMSFVAALVVSGIGYWLARSGRFYAAVYLFLSGFVVLLLFVVFMGGRTAFTVSEETGLGWGVVATAIMISFVLACMSWLFGESINNAFSTLKKRSEELKATKEELRARNDELQAANDKLLQTQEQLIRSEKLAAIGQLASGVGHELRNPLGAIKNAAFYIRRRAGNTDLPTTEPRVMEFLSIIDEEVNSANKVITDLLGFSRVSKPAAAPANIAGIIEDALRYTPIPKKVALTKEINNNLSMVTVDGEQIKQVFVNIVLNAEHFMGKAHNRGKLLVKTGKVNGNIRASLTDDGTGISLENLDKIFNPFFTTKEVGKGTGLGLSICHSIITQHQGRIYAQSQPGKGATFVIELPIVAEPVQTGKAEETKKEPQKSRGAKILVVDDEQAILTFLSRLLTEWGHTVETINNADAALERLKTERYSLILLDIKLPGMSGIELYHHIEEIVPALTRRVMFITGDVMEGTTREFLEKAKAAHITKPLDIEALKKMINRALNQTQAAPVA